MSSASSTFHISDQDGTIQNLRDLLDRLSPSIEQLKVKSKSVLAEWQEYNRALLQLERILREAQAEIDRVETSAVNVEAYETGTRRAQVIARRFFFRHRNTMTVALLGTSANHGVTST